MNKRKTTSFSDQKLTKKKKISDNSLSLDEFLRNEHEISLKSKPTIFKLDIRDINNIGLGEKMQTKGKNDFKQVYKYLNENNQQLEKIENELYENIIKNKIKYNALHGYLDTYYENINRYLDPRNIEKCDPGSDDEDVKTGSESDNCDTKILQHIENIDTIFDYITPIQEEFNVYRCYRNPEIVNILKNDLKINDSIKNIQYLSTSLSLSVSKYHCNTIHTMILKGNGFVQGGGFIVQILIPSGSHIIPIFDYSKFTKTNNESNISESEILLDRRGSLKLIKRIKEEPINSKKSAYKIDPDFYYNKNTKGLRIRHPLESVRMIFEYIPPDYAKINIKNNEKKANIKPYSIFNSLKNFSKSFFSAKTAGGYYKMRKHTNKKTRKHRKKRKTLKK